MYQILLANGATGASKTIIVEGNTTVGDILADADNAIYLAGNQLMLNGQFITDTDVEISSFGLNENVTNTLASIKAAVGA